jgi:class 3 adenylate cyclase
VQGGRGPQTHVELAAEVGLSFESLQRIVEACGFARPEPGDAVVEAERPVARLMGRAVELGIVEEAVASVRFGNVYAEALRGIGRRPAARPCRGGRRAGDPAGGDYFGRTVNLASRIADRAHGGQVLVSEPVAAMTSVPGVRFAALGPIALPGLTSPVQLFEARRS